MMKTSTVKIIQTEPDFSCLNAEFLNLYHQAIRDADGFFTLASSELYLSGQMKQLLEQLGLTREEFHNKYVIPFSEPHNGLLPLIAKAITVECGGRFELSIKPTIWTEKQKSVLWTRAQIVTLCQGLEGFDPITHAQNQKMVGWELQNVIPFKQCLYCGKYNPHFREGKKDFVWFCHSQRCDHLFNSHPGDCHMTAWRNEKKKIKDKLKRKSTEAEFKAVFKNIFFQLLEANKDKPPFLPKNLLSSS